MILDANGATETVHTPGLTHRTGMQDLYYHNDAVGSTRWLSDANTSFPNTLGYTAFGELAYEQGGDYPTPYLFGGGNGYQSEYAADAEPGVGLQYLQQRYYDPALGRFISPDPIGISGGLNLYGYCGGDPVNRADPSGEAATPVDALVLLADVFLLTRDYLTGAPAWQKGLDWAALGMDATPFVPGGTGRAFAIAGHGARVAQAAHVADAAHAVSAATRPARAGSAAGRGARQATGGGSGSPPGHHVATNKNKVGGYSARLQAIFDRAGMKLSDRANIVPVVGHKGPHAAEYHEWVLQRLDRVTQGLSKDKAAGALRDELGKIGREVQQNPGLLRGEGL